MKKLFYLLLIAVFIVGCKGKTNENNENQDELQVEKFSAEETLNAFLEALADGDFQKAYDFTNIPKWGSFDDFSSEDAFGGIVDVEINELKLSKVDGETNIFYVDAKYFDDVNGNKSFKQNFYLKKENDIWKIVDMKVISMTDEAKDNKPLVGSYEGDLGTLEIVSVYNEFFMFNISIVTENANCIGEIQDGKAHLSNGEWVFDDEDIILKFKFTKKNVELTEEKFSYYFHGASCTFDGIYNLQK